VQKDDGIACADIYIGHFGVENSDLLTFIRVNGRNFYFTHDKCLQMVTNKLDDTGFVRDQQGGWQSRMPITPGMLGLP
jgi:hypothetical protein